MFIKLKRVSSFGSLNHIPNFRKEFPELRCIDDEDLSKRFYRMNVKFYSVESEKVNGFIRLTLPFALITIMLLFLILPINFIITGRWNYNFKADSKIYCWLKSLKLI